MARETVGTAEATEAGMSKYLKATSVFLFILLPITMLLIHFATPPQRAWLVWGFALIAVVVAVWMVAHALHDGGRKIRDAWRQRR
jgi:membrane protein YdbS with pleckstrin-like domain